MPLLQEEIARVKDAGGLLIDALRDDEVLLLIARTRSDERRDAIRVVLDSFDVSKKTALAVLRVLEPLPKAKRRRIVRHRRRPAKSLGRRLHCRYGASAYVCTTTGEAHAEESARSTK
jgi:hypothetical protein